MTAKELILKLKQIENKAYQMQYENLRLIDIKNLMRIGEAAEKEKVKQINKYARDIAVKFGQYKQPSRYELIKSDFDEFWIKNINELY